MIFALDFSPDHLSLSSLIPPSLLIYFRRWDTETTDRCLRVSVQDTRTMQRNIAYFLTMLRWVPLSRSYLIQEVYGRLEKERNQASEIKNRQKGKVRLSVLSGKE